MPRGYSTRQATNESEVYQALVAATKGYGNVIRFAERVGIRSQSVHAMLDGGQRVSVEVARHLGYTLRWIKPGSNERVKE
jgi:hypothetical protein